MPASPLRKLAGLADSARKAGRLVLPLNIGQPDIAMPEGLIQRALASSRQNLPYSPSEGFASYRNKLAAHYRSYGDSFSEQDIMITAGGSEGILFSLLACLDPGEELLVPEPYYANVNGFAHQTGVKLVGAPTLADFRTKLTTKTRALMICNPNNPTGHVYSQVEMVKFAEFAIEHNLFLILDETYRDFIFGGTRMGCLAGVSDLEEKLVVIDSISKKYNLCGARIGSLMTKNRELIENMKKFAQARLSPSTLGQSLGEIALEVPHSYVSDVVGEYEARRNLVVDAMSQMKGVHCPSPMGAFYAMPSLPVDDVEQFCEWLLTSFSHKNSTVCMAPGPGFYQDPSQGRNQVRIAYVIGRESLSAAMECLEAGLLAYQKLPGVHKKSA